MRFENSYIPYGGYWSSPFCKWQGSFSGMHPLALATEVARAALAEREIAAEQLDRLYLGMTVPAPHAFYGPPWLAGLLGAEAITGPLIAQACATSARLVASAAHDLEANPEGHELILCLAADRTSNGPHLVYPNPLAPGGRADTEDWVWDNFNCDPFAGQSMLETAENVARDCNISTAEQHEVVLRRYDQYQQALADDSAFHKRYMVTPVEVNPTGRRVAGEVKGDEGIFPTTAEGLARLRPVLPGGTVTFGGQTYPADGNAGLVITSRSRAAALSRDPDVEIQLLAFAEGRTQKGYMPMANVPAAARALQKAGLALQEVKAIKTHNPFAVNDCYMSRELGIAIDEMNNYGSSLIWGHPQAPTGLRLIVELIEELVLRGGGYGLFTGCAAGDTAAAVVLEVRQR